MEAGMEAIIYIFRISIFFIIPFPPIVGEQNTKFQRCGYLNMRVHAENLAFEINVVYMQYVGSPDFKDLLLQYSSYVCKILNFDYQIAEI